MFLILMFSVTLVSAEFIEPLDMRTWIVDILSGSPEIFTAVGLISLFALAGFFRMNMLTTIFMLAVFFLIFGTAIDQPLYFLILAIGSLVAGYTLNKLIKR